MELRTHSLTFKTRGHTDIVDITPQVSEVLASSGLVEGAAALFVIGSTAAVTTIEYEPGLVETDVKEMFERIAPYEKEYAHNGTWGDDNGAAHLRASLLGSSLTVPFGDGRLLLGTWQQVVVVDFDTRPRRRSVVLQLQGLVRADAPRGA